MADNHAEIEEIESIDDRIKAENMETYSRFQAFSMMDASILQQTP